MINLDYIIDPVIGTIIGFGTNYLAVKMLFRPYKAIKIGKFTLPFTPGVIPKRKDEFAKAFGKIISNNLFTSEDIKEVFLSEDIKKIVVEECTKGLLNDEKTIKNIILDNIDDEKYENLKLNIEKVLAQKIVKGLLSLNLGDIIAKEGISSVKEKLKQSFFGSFISEDKITDMAYLAGEKIENYIRENGEEFIIPCINDEINGIEKSTVLELFNKCNIDKNKIEEYCEKIYLKILDEKMNNIFNSFNISEIVESKISKMDVKEIENLFMIVMKKELNAIVNLGAILGFLIGTINIFL